MRLIIPLLFLLLTGCQREEWRHTAIRNSNRDYDIAKLTYPPSNLNDGLELELTRYGKEIHGYINVYTFELPTYKEDPHATTLTIATSSVTQTFVISLLEGGQRARLTDICLEYLLQTLILKPTVTLFSGHFSQTLKAENFKRHYEALLREPSLLRPQNLITFEIF